MLVDFGMAPDIRALERHITLQDPDWTSFRYMSPESIEEGVITTETDVYSFGLLALEVRINVILNTFRNWNVIRQVLSGNAPYHNLGHVAAMIKITEGSTPLPGDHPRIPYPSPAWDMMQRCWATDPSKRPVIEEVNVWVSLCHSRSLDYLRASSSLNRLRNGIWRDLVLRYLAAVVAIVVALMTAVMVVVEVLPKKSG